MSSKAENSEAITFYIAKELAKMGYYNKVRRSTKSEDSWYITIYIGTRDNSAAVWVRISDHNTLSKYSVMPRCDFDISVSRYREKAINFIEFFVLFAARQKKPVPREIANILSAPQEVTRSFWPLKEPAASKKAPSSRPCKAPRQSELFGRSVRASGA